MKTLTKLASATLATAFVAPMALAQGSISNTMTNIVTIVDSCDLAAIGIDFGVQPGSISSDIVGTQANTTAGNLLSGNGTHPDAATDGGADDTLSLNTPVAALNGPISTALSTLVGTLPGVFVACTSTPSTLVVDGADGDATLSLDTVAAATPNTDFDSELLPSAGGAAGATGSIDYTVQFTGVVASVDLGVPGAPALFTGVYTAVGTIPAASNTDVKTAGFYSDVATATLTF